MDVRILHLVATVIDACGQPGRRRRGHPRAATVRVLAALRRFDRLLRLVLVEGERVPELRELVTDALQGPGEQVSWADSPQTVLRLAALGGYHLFSTVQGRPFQGAPEEEFLAALAALVPAP